MTTILINQLSTSGFWHCAWARGWKAKNGNWNAFLPSSRDNQGDWIRFTCWYLGFGYKCHRNGRKRSSICWSSPDESKSICSSVTIWSWYWDLCLQVLYLVANNPAPSFAHPELWSAEFKDFVSKCLEVNYEKRPTAKQLLKVLSPILYSIQQPLC